MTLRGESRVWGGRFDFVADDARRTQPKFSCLIVKQACNVVWRRSIFQLPVNDSTRALSIVSCARMHACARQRPTGSHVSSYRHRTVPKNKRPILQRKQKLWTGRWHHHTAETGVHWVREATQGGGQDHERGTFRADRLFKLCYYYNRLSRPYLHVALFRGEGNHVFVPGASLGPAPLEHLGHNDKERRRSIKIVVVGAAP